MARCVEVTPIDDALAAAKASIPHATGMMNADLSTADLHGDSAPISFHGTL